LDNNKNISYSGTIYLGSGDQLQPVRAVFDTGSANPWILSKEAVIGGGANQYYDITETRFVEEGGHFSQPPEEDRQITKITFGSGFLRGYFVTDSLTLGDPSEDSKRVSVGDWTFGMVIEETCFTKQFDAIIGLAYPQFAEPGVTPLMDALINSKVLK